jgi:ABC-type branched-subunit amino acid transport system ATPase component
MTINFTVPTVSGDKPFTVDAGSSIYFVGANGGGKTRLAVHVEKELGEKVHRISAHRALALKTDIAKVSEEHARRGLRFGNDQEYADLNYRENYRWSENAPVSLLDDYKYLLQTLFAEQSNTALKTHKNAREGKKASVDETLFERLIDIWNRILPHRQLEITGDDIKVRPASGGDPYPAKDMSDGERASFYLIGQTLAADEGVLLVFDEPELHLHRAILSRLWDELEASRPDCAFLVISHDLDFVASRSGDKYVLRDYKASKWDIEEVPDDTGFSEELTTLILGSRKPILFVEGAGSSLDLAIYRACYPEWTIVPRGSCEQVIHAVITMRANAKLTRITCAGIVDADDYSETEIEYLDGKGIAVLPVSEIENLFLLPDVLDAVLTIEGHSDPAKGNFKSSLVNDILGQASDSKSQIECALRYARRRIDRSLKKVDLSQATDASALRDAYNSCTSAIDVEALVQTASGAISDAIASRDICALLRWYDNKGLVNIAAKAKNCSKTSFEQWAMRSLRNGTAPALSTALGNALPTIQAK